MERVCGGDGVPSVNDFRCEDCLVICSVCFRTSKQLIFREDGQCQACVQNVEEVSGPQCPACNAPTFKTSGCNHITCICGEHWCWNCASGGFDAGSIYEHIYECSGR